jgi:hypothetical protein
MSYGLYEFYKAEWISKHKNHTPQEYEYAMLKIARKCGI